MRVVIPKSSATHEVADGKILFRTMLDELNAIENYGEEMPPAADDSLYMFKDASEVDMDAYCDPNVDLQKLGVSVDGQGLHRSKCVRQLKYLISASQR